MSHMDIAVSSLIFQHPILTAFILFVGYYVFSSIHCLYISPLRTIPGPFVASFSRLYLSLGYVARGRFYSAVLINHRKYGPIIRLAPNRVYIADPEYLTEIYGTKSEYTKSNIYEVQLEEPGRGNLISETNKERHQWLKRRVAPAYSLQNAGAIEGIIGDLISQWLEILENEFIRSDSSNLEKDKTEKNYSDSNNSENDKREKKYCDFVQWSQYLIYDVISSLAFGKEFGFIQQKKDVNDYIATVQGAFSIFTPLAYFPEVVKLFRHPIVRKLSKRNIEDGTGAARLLCVATELVSKRWEENGGDREMSSPLPKQRDGGKRQDMLQRFWEQGLSIEDTIQESLLILLAGSDTTAVLMRAAVLFICSNPPVYNKLKAELRPHINLSNKRDIIPYSTAISLPYLTACIKESLRIHPPVAGPMGRVVPPTGANILGHYLPPGIDVVIHPWVINRDASIFAPDPDCFRPERWLEEQDEKKLKRMERCVEFVFGGGRYTCLGKGIAMMEAYKALAELVGRFEIGIGNVGWAGAGSTSEEYAEGEGKCWISKEYQIFLQKYLMLGLEKAQS